MTAVATSPQSREELILSHLPQVRLIAKSFRRCCPSGTELDDLVGIGTIGLIQAVDRFDASRGLKLKTLAEHRIRGAILDYLRAIDPLPRSVQSSLSSVNRSFPGTISPAAGRHPIQPLPS